MLIVQGHASERPNDVELRTQLTFTGVRLHHDRVRLAKAKIRSCEKDFENGCFLKLEP
jgi:hypothetical protein